MSIALYTMSGSPYAWRVRLALEHKKLSYDVHTLSFSDGDLQKPNYLAINPRGKVPAIVDDGFALWESVAIVEYLDQQYPDSGKPLFPRNPKGAATTRRMVQEVDHYYGVPNESLVVQILFSSDEERNHEIVDDARAEIAEELARWETIVTNDFLAGGLGAADFALYPLLALTLRMEMRFPRLAIEASLGPRLRAWKARVESLPYFDATYPPHWRAA